MPPGPPPPPAPATRGSGRLVVLVSGAGTNLQALLAEPGTANGRAVRDTVLLTLAYDTAARVQELCDLDIADVRAANPMTVTISGKEVAPGWNAPPFAPWLVAALDTVSNEAFGAPARTLLGLALRLRATGIDSFARYLDALEAGKLSGPDGQEWEAFTNALTTNLTSFFREAHHFPLLAEHALKARRLQHPADGVLPNPREEPHDQTAERLEARRAERAGKEEQQRIERTRYDGHRR